MLDFTDTELEQIKANIHKLPAGLKQQVTDQMAELAKRKSASTARDTLVAFGKQTYPNFMVGAHHRKITAIFEAIARGEKKRVIINIAPRHGKSVLSSILMPAWFMGKFPDKKIIMASHTADLSVDFGRKVRDMIADPAYQKIFPEVELKADAKAAGRWSTNKGGEYYAVGVGGALAGRGADLCLGERTQIKTDDGTVTIKDIQIGQEIVTPSGRGVVTKKKLTTHKTKVVINSTIEASLEHPFNTTKGWKQAGELHIGDRVLTLSIWRRLWRYKAK